MVPLSPKTLIIVNTLTVSYILDYFTCDLYDESFFTLKIKLKLF